MINEEEGAYVGRRINTEPTFGDGGEDQNFSPQKKTPIKFLVGQKNKKEVNKLRQGNFFGKNTGRGFKYHQSNSREPI